MYEACQMSLGVLSHGLSEDHDEWVRSSLEQISKIKAGSTSADVEKLFFSMGGYLPARRPHTVTNNASTLK
jgi:hypothetical protein